MSDHIGDIDADYIGNPPMNLEKALDEIERPRKALRTITYGGNGTTCITDRNRIEFLVGVARSALEEEAGDE